MNADHVEEQETPAMRIATSHHDHPEAPGASPQPSADQDRLPGIRHLIAVGSGKGGVGKSTVAAMSGGCQGCAASNVTLRQGFEVMVRRVAPEIADIVDTTDHAAGAKPFYGRTR